MRTPRLLTYALVAVALMGCKGSAIEIANRSEETLHSSPDHEILYAYAANKTPRLREELNRRGFFTDEEWSQVDAGQVRIGDPERVVWAAWGPPQDVSRLSTDYSQSKILYYSGYVSPGVERNARVYIDNGVVTAIGQ